MTILGLSLAMFAACISVVLVGAVIQGTLGIGLGMVSAPILAIADRDLIPVAILICVLPLTVSMVVRERASIDRRGVVLPVIGRVPGVALGAAAVALAGDRILSVLVAISVLGAVAASVLATNRGLRFRTTRTSLVAAGAVSGFMGTTTGIGGPPMALTYQHADAAVMRSTISAYFTIGSMLSLGGLAASGSLGTRETAIGIALVPAVMIGFAISRPLTERLANDRFRAGVLGVCALSAIALLISEFA